MSRTPPQSPFAKYLETPVDPSDREALYQWIATLRSSDRLLHYLMAAEVWAIIKAMDERFPGFWNRFMTHRQAALRTFVERKRHGKNSGDSEGDVRFPSPTDAAPESHS